MRLDSTYALAPIEVATVHRMLGECERTDSIGRQLLASGRPLAAFDRAFLDGQLAACRGDPQGMHRSALEQVRLAPQSVNAAYSLFHGLLALNRPVAAAAALEPFSFDRAAAELGPSMFAAWAIDLHVIGRDARALEVARAGIARFPDQRRLWFVEQLALAGQRRAPEVIEGLRRSLARRTGPMDLNVALIPIAIDLRIHVDTAANTAFALLDSALDAAPAVERASADYRRARAELDYVQGRWARAHDQFVTLADHPRWSIDAHGHLGALAARSGDRASAERELAWLARIPPTRTVAPLTWRVRINALLGERTRAVELMTEAVRFSPQLFITALMHSRADLDALRGDPAFEAIVRPRG